VRLFQPICPTTTCAHCPRLPTCDAPRTRLLQFGNDLDVLPVAPLDKAVWQPPTVGGPPPPDSREPKPYCPVVPRRYYDYSYAAVLFCSLAKALSQRHFVVGGGGAPTAFNRRRRRRRSAASRRA